MAADIKDAQLGHSLIQVSHPHLFELNVTNLEAREAAARILAHLSNYFL
jgi:hypothetical protein